MPRRRACGATTAWPIRCSPTRSSSTWRPSSRRLAGPKRPQDRVRAQGGEAELRGRPGLARRRQPERRQLAGQGDRTTASSHGDVVIAAITSCTNTSNPGVMIAAGLVAKKAAEKGLTRKPWVKTSLAPGSRVVTEYLAKADLQGYLDAGRLRPGRLWLHHLHRQFRAAAGCDRRRDHGRQARGVGGAVGQSQLRGACPCPGQGQLPGFAAAGRGLCAGGLHAQGHHHRAAGHGQGRQTGLP